MLLALALAAAQPFDTKADYGALAREHCAIEWPDDFQMQAHCWREQNRGMLQFKGVAEEFGPRLHKALEKCTEDWTKDGLPDWQMIGFCAVEQARGYIQVSE